MNNIIIRKANADYVCQVCGKIIHSGEEYLDRVILNNGKCVQHERYHDECPRPHIAQKLIDMLIENKELPVLYDGMKYWLTGIQWHNGELACIIIDWNRTCKEPLYVSVEVFNKEWRYD